MFKIQKYQIYLTFFAEIPSFTLPLYCFRFLATGEICWDTTDEKSSTEKFDLKIHFDPITNTGDYVINVYWLNGHKSTFSALNFKPSGYYGKLVSISSTCFWAAFTCADPKRAKKGSKVKQLFALLRSAHVKAVRKHVDEIEPRSISRTMSKSCKFNQS